MPENKGFYEKYRVERIDGKPIIGPTFTLELDHDPFAKVALRAYCEAAFQDGNYPKLVEALNEILSRLS